MDALRAARYTYEFVSRPIRRLMAYQRAFRRRVTVYKIAVLPGDGTGPEVVAEGLKVLAALADKFSFTYETT